MFVKLFSNQKLQQFSRASYVSWPIAFAFVVLMVPRLFGWDCSAPHCIMMNPFSGNDDGWCDLGAFSCYRYGTIQGKNLTSDWAGPGGTLKIDLKDDGHTKINNDLYSSNYINWWHECDCTDKQTVFCWNVWGTKTSTVWKRHCKVGVPL
jgi:hypothetical protein